MEKIARLDGLVPDRLAPVTRKIVLEDYALTLDIGFHEFEVGNPQRLMVSVEVWVDERSFAVNDAAECAWKSTSGVVTFPFRSGLWPARRGSS